jgi:hypothetical protein
VLELDHDWVEKRRFVIAYLRWGVW